jgi:hypothetical protein
MRFLVVLSFLSLLLIAPVFAGNCVQYESYGVEISFDGGPIPPNTYLRAINNCSGDVELLWDGALNLTFGPIQDDEVVMTDNSVYVDSLSRPDLDGPATLIFRNSQFVMRPGVLRDGVVCGDCLESWDDATRTLTVGVNGFSNYSLTAIQDFLVYQDPKPELKDKVYQTIDLGDANRNVQHSCVVQLYGLDDANQYVLVQTNPRRGVPARLFGSPDVNNPESLGYFPTVNGIANVYFDGSSLAGYQDLVYVAQCANNASLLLYEEQLSTRYSPFGRSVTARGVWFADGANAVFIIFTAFAGLLGFYILMRIWRRR